MVPVAAPGFSVAEGVETWTGWTGRTKMSQSTLESLGGVDPRLTFRDGRPELSCSVRSAWPGGASLKTEMYRVCKRKRKRILSICVQYRPVRRYHQRRISQVESDWDLYVSPEIRVPTWRRRRQR